MNRDRDAGLPCDLAQEDALARVAVDQLEAQRRMGLRRDDGADEAGKPASTPEVEPEPLVNVGGVENLQRIQEMPRPQGVQRSRRHEVDLPLPLAKKLGVEVEARECFT